jgi:hypothetical protein
VTTRARILAVGVAALTCLGSLAIWKAASPTGPPHKEAIRQHPTRSRGTSVSAARPQPVRRIVAQTQALNAPESSPQQDAATIRDLIGSFRRLAKGNPIGENEEVTAQLMGRDPRGPAVTLIDPRNPAIDSRGQLVDRWGTPYFFHALSANNMEIRSAGPDRKMWTADDVVGDGE